MNKAETAYHEAGHAVVAHFAGLTFESVSIVEDEESWGRCLTPLPEGFQPDGQGEGSIDLLKSQLAVCMAGAAAQQMWTGRPVELAGNDLRGVTTLVSSLGGTSEQMSAAADAAQERAETMLRREWAAVDALAACLLERQELTGEQAVDTMRKARR